MADQDQKVTISACGRLVKLGQFYDYCRDCIDTETSTLSEKSISKWVTKEILSDCTKETCNYERAYEVLGIDVNTRLNVCLGYVEPGEDVRLLFNYRPEGEEETLLVERCIKKAKRLDLEKLSNLMSGQVESNQSATHVVTGIVYGWERVSPAENEEGDSDEPCSKPEMQGMQNEPQTVPMLVEIHPLNHFKTGKEFQELDETLVMKTIDSIQTMTYLKEKCDQLLQGTNSKAKTILLSEVSAFKSLVVKQMEKVTEYLHELVPSVREMEEEEEDFENFVSEIEESPFNPEVTVQWLQNKEQELLIIDEISNTLGPKSFIAAKMGLTAKLKKLGKVCNLQIKVPNKNKLLQKMEENLDDECDDDFDIAQYEENQENAEQLSQTWEQMQGHIEEEKEKMAGLFSIERADVCAFECKLRFYVNGKIMNTEISSEDQPEIETTVSSPPIRKQRLQKEKKVPSFGSSRNKPSKSEFGDQSEKGTAAMSTIESHKEKSKKRIQQKNPAEYKISSFEHSGKKSSRKKIPVALPPGKPWAEDVSHNKIKLEWTQPDIGASKISVTEYIIFDEDGNEVATVDGDETFAEIKITAKLVPAFTVQADYGEHGTSPHSEASDPFESSLWEDTIPAKLVVMQAFGQSFEIGQLYDRRNALILEEGIKMRDLKDHIITNDCQSGKISAGTLSFEETLDKLAIDTETSLDIILGFVQPGGAKTFLNGDKDFSEKEFTLQQIITKTKHISPKSLPKGSYKNADPEATHIVAGITYGCDILSYEGVTDSGGETEIYNDLSQEVLEDGRMAKVTADVKKRLKTKPSLADPVKVHLFPIPGRDYEPIDAELANRVIAVFNNYQNALDHCSTVGSHAKLGNNAVMKTRCDAFRNLITAKKKQFSKRITSLVPDIRGSCEDSYKLQQLLKTEDSSPFNHKTIKKWFQMMKEDMKFITDIEKQLPGVNKFNSYEEIQEDIRSFRGVLYCLAVSMPVEDIILKEMDKAIGNQGGHNRTSEEKASNMHVQDDGKSALPEKIKVFLHLKNHSKDTDRFAFLICCQSSSLSDPFAVSIHQYRDSKLVASDVGSLSKPQKLRAVNVNDSSLQLEWVDPGNDKPVGYNIIVQSRDGTDRRYHSQTCEVMIGDLTAETMYKIKVCSVDDTMESEFSDEFQVETLKADAASPPGQPKCREIASHRLEIEWSHPKRILKPIEEYLVYDKDKGIMAKVRGTTNSCIIVPELNTLYQFTVVANCGRHGSSKFSEPSDPIEVQLSEEERRKEMIIGNADLLVNKINGPPTYLLKLKCISSQVQKTCKMEFGKPADGKQEKTIMLLGATGSGKTTLINGMINFIFGVEWDDNFRVRLIPEESTAANQAESQTSIITSYTIHHRPGFQVPFTLTIVDTPGFGDTSGIGKDKEITKQIDKFFRAKGKGGLDQISAIGFVAQSSLARLTVSQRYIFDSILSLFGKDIADNIVPLLTFADGQKPQVLDALKVANIPFKEYFKFNSSALFVANSKQKDGDDDFDEMFWKMGTKSFQKYFHAVQTMPNRSLQLTKQLLTERETLQVQIEGINKDISTGVTKLHQLDQELDMLKKHESDIDRNKNFKYTVEEEQVEMTKITDGTFTTNCLTCRRTCHDNCAFQDDEEKIYCCAMSDGNCTVCKGKCLWSEHKNLPHTYKITMVSVTKTAEELKQRYQTAQGEYMTMEKVVNGLMGDFEKTHQEIILRSIEARRCITRIREIALKPNPLSTSEYVDLMIEGEKNERKDGYQLRIKQLQEVRKTAEIVEQLTGEGYDPFTDHADMITKVKERGNFDKNFDQAKKDRGCSVM